MSASTRHGYYTRDHFSDKQQHFIHQAVGRKKDIFLTGLAGSGKLQPLDELILTPNGWTEMRNIVPESIVFNKNGEQIKVLEVFPGNDLNIYKITFSDDTFVECCEDHLWEVQTTKLITNNRYKVMSLKEMLPKIQKERKSKKHGFHYSIDLPKPIQFDKKEILIHPYLLGVLLGNGYIPKNNQVCLTMHEDCVEEVFDKISLILPPYVEIKHDRIYESFGKARRIIFNKEIKKYLKEINLLDTNSHTKFIPEQYLYNSIENRKQLLFGLMDTDGCIQDFGTKKKISYSTMSNVLCDNIIELIRSLGGHAEKNILDRTHHNKGIEYNVKLRTSFNPFTIKKRASIFEKYTWTQYFKKRIVSAEYVGKKDGQCILVDDPSHLYLTRGYTVTHNTAVLKKVVQILQKKNKSVACVAPTGIAATNMGGQTIHSLFALQPYGVLSYDICRFLKGEKRLVLSCIQTLIIDEISMVRADMLDGINWTLQKNGCGSLSRKQVIFVGDMKQLAPVVSDNTRSVMFETYKGVDFTHAQIYDKIKPITIELDKVFRQTDTTFVDNLNIIREGGRSDYFRRFVHTETKGVILAPYKYMVEKYNMEGLDRQQGELLTFKAHIEGNAKDTDFNLEPEIKIKNGCKIMYLVNSKDNPLVNGTMGIFEHEDIPDTEDGINYIRVGNVKYPLLKSKITKFEYVYNNEKDKIELEEIGSITQYPIRLAYALTIHKSQGMTLDEVTLDLSTPIRSEGMLYVGLSRVRTPQGLRMIMR